MWVRWKVGPPKAGKWQVIYFFQSHKDSQRWHAFLTCHPPPVHPQVLSLLGINKSHMHTYCTDTPKWSMHTDSHTQRYCQIFSHWFKVVTFPPDYLPSLPLLYSISSHLHNEWTQDPLLVPEIKCACYYGRKHSFHVWTVQCALFQLHNMHAKVSSKQLHVTEERQADHCCLKIRTFCIIEQGMNTGVSW